MADAERWQHVERLYHDALARDPCERASFVREACGDDEALRAEIESLLAYAYKTDGFMQTPAIALAAAPGPPGREREYMLAPGACLGPYTIVAPLGAGGMGEVYRARDARLGRDVAVKILPDRITRDPAAVERFSREARAASALNHPNIVTIHEIGESDGRRFIVMELVLGSTLRTIIPQPFALDTFVPVATQMARALAVAHVAGIVHRDIKPENVMVREDGYVKLLDFGLARLAVDEGQGSAAPLVAKTVAAIPIGTVRYMSPEQARGEAMTSATDIFSLGITLYELAAGQRPFAGLFPGDAMHAMLTGVPDPPSRISPQVPAVLDAIILRMLEKDARRRPTATEIEAALSEMGGRRIGPSPARVALERRRHTVGRVQERAELREAFETAVAQRGLLVSVAGEAGLGKTTLVEDVLNELAGEGRYYRVARGRCSERLAGTGAYLPWLEALDGLLQGDGRESAAALMKVSAPTWYERLKAADPAEPHDEAAVVPQERLKRELVAFLQEITRHRALVLFFDDVHWADLSTIDLLAYVASKLDELPLLIVATYRPSELLLARHPFVSVKLELQGRGACREMPLGFLTREDTEQYLALEFPDHRFPADLPALIHARTEGNPLFMADLVRHMRSTQVIAEEHGRWVLARSVPDLRQELPETVRSMIQRKISQLGTSDLHLLVAASVQGYQFDSAVVASALRMEPAEVEERLDVLERVHAFVRLVGEEALPDGTLTVRYRFVHVLYQNALFASLRPTRKAALSGAVAEAVLGCSGSERHAVASELAVLFETARSFDRAADHFLAAAQQAASLSAHREAVALARRGLEALSRVPDTPERARRELLLQTTLGPAVMITGGHGINEVEAIYTRARDLCQEVGETPQLFPVVWGLWHFALVRAECAAAKRLAERLLAWATKIDDPALLLLAHNSLANTFWVMGDFATARAHAEEAVRLYVPQRHHALGAFYGGHDPGVACRSFLALTMWSVGLQDQALQKSADAVALARELGDVYSTLFALSFQASVHQYRREAVRTRELAEEAVVIAADLGMMPWLAWGTALRGWAIAAQGQTEEGIVQLRQSVAGCRQVGAVAPLVNFLVMLADAHAAAGQIDDGLAAVTEALTISQQSGVGYVEAELHRLQGELLTDPADKEACFRRAVDIARRQRADSFELRTLVSVSRLYARQDREPEAARMLAPVYRRFAEGFETDDLKQATWILERLPESPRG